MGDKKKVNFDDPSLREDLFANRMLIMLFSFLVFASDLMLSIGVDISVYIRIQFGFDLVWFIRFW